MAFIISWFFIENEDLGDIFAVLKKSFPLLCEDDWKKLFDFIKEIFAVELLFLWLFFLDRYNFNCLNLYNY